MDGVQAGRVLIVEDNAMVGEMIQGILKRLGYTVVDLVVDGDGALEAMARLSGTPEQPDVILMDIEMPGMDGIEATARIQDRYPTPVVILTAYDRPDLIERASAVGVGAYLLKPPNQSELERAITIATARFEDMRALRHLNEALQAEIAERTRAQQALDVSNRELRLRNHQERVLARTVSRFNGARSIEEVIDILLHAVTDLGYPYFALWERRQDRLHWNLARQGMPPWFVDSLGQIANKDLERGISVALNADNLYARCYREKSFQSTDQAEDVLRDLCLGYLPFQYLPDATQQAGLELIERLGAARHHAYPLGDYGVLLFSSPRAVESRAHHEWVQLVLDQGVTALERQRLIAQLQQALAEVRKLSGLLPICANCKKIRDDRGYWHQVEEYLESHSGAQFTHGLCPDCAHRLYPELFSDDEPPADHAQEADLERSDP